MSYPQQAPFELSIKDFGNEQELRRLPTQF
jgi:hypothetical protein